MNSWTIVRRLEAEITKVPHIVPKEELEWYKYADVMF